MIKAPCAQAGEQRSWEQQPAAPSQHAGGKCAQTCQCSSLLPMKAGCCYSQGSADLHLSFSLAQLMSRHMPGSDLLCCRPGPSFAQRCCMAANSAAPCREIQPGRAQRQILGQQWGSAGARQPCLGLAGAHQRDHSLRGGWASGPEWRLHGLLLLASQPAPRLPGSCLFPWTLILQGLSQMRSA